MNIYEDDREIESIAFPSPYTGDSYKVGANKITKIEAYKETGHGSYVVWFNLWRGDKLYGRINGMHVEGVYYKDK